jgi:hypothetical protein
VRTLTVVSGLICRKPKLEWMVRIILRTTFKQAASSLYTDDIGCRIEKKMKCQIFTDNRQIVLLAHRQNAHGITKSRLETKGKLSGNTAPCHTHDEKPRAQGSFTATVGQRLRRMRVLAGNSKLTYRSIFCDNTAHMHNKRVASNISNISNDATYASFPLSRKVRRAVRGSGRPMGWLESIFLIASGGSRI